MNRKLNKRITERSKKRSKKRSKNKKRSLKRNLKRSLKRIRKINDGTTPEETVMTTEQRFRNKFRNPPHYGETLSFSEIIVNKEGDAIGAAAQKIYTNCRCRIWWSPLTENYKMTISFYDTANEEKHDTYNVSNISNWTQTH